MDVNSEGTALRFDYEQTIGHFKLLADIRFKLLAFVPTLAGIAVGLLTTDKVNDETALAVGLLGFIVTLGITFYEIRNSQLYDAAIHRAKWLEVLLDLPVFTKDPRTQKSMKTGGVFNERPGRRNEHQLKLFGLITVWHDRGLSIAYGAALGGWTFIITNSLLALEGHPDFRYSILVAALVGIGLAWQIIRLSRKGRPAPTLVPFEKKTLPDEYDYLAPDGSEIRLLPTMNGGGLAHCTLPAGGVSKPVYHRTVEEIWYFLEGKGEVWRKQGMREEVVGVHPGVSLTIPVGTRFQFKNIGDEPLKFIIVTMPPWPGEDEAVKLKEGRWSLEVISEK